MRRIRVDTTGIVQRKFWESKKSYEKAKRRGEIKTAIEEAANCSKYLKLLAKAIPFEKGHYLKLASSYDLEVERLKEIEESPPEKRALRRPKRRVPGADIRQMELDFEDEARMLISRANISWGDIANLDDVKKLLKEVVFYLLVEPKEKKVKLTPPRTILLYGPPGTGKTMLAMAASNGLGATFFNVSTDRLLSKYVGDSPRLVSALFRVAAKQPLSVVFLDDIEVLMARRDDMANAATGVVQTFLTELDGFVSKVRASPVLVVVATNKPWMIDEAILGRFHRRIYVPLPDEKARQQILRLHLEEKGFDVEVEYGELARSAERFSGRDIMIACESAKLAMLRRANPNAHELVGGDVKVLRSARFEVLPIARKELFDALSMVKSVTTVDMLERYEEWRSRYGIE